MKIKKLLPLVLLAAAAVLMLSSCDAMLDAIFPSDQISVDVMVSKVNFFNDWYSGNPSTVAITLTDVTAGGAQTTQVGGWSDIDSNYVHYVFTFLNLKDHVYSVTAYYHSYFNSGTYGPNFDFFDGPIDLVGGVRMPYRTGHDSTGHSADFQMYF